MKKVLLYIAVFVLLTAVSFLMTAGLYWAACWAFGFAFRWRYAVGIFAIEWFLFLTFGKSKGARE